MKSNILLLERHRRRNARQAIDSVKTGHRKGPAKSVHEYGSKASHPKGCFKPLQWLDNRAIAELTQEEFEALWPGGNAGICGYTLKKKLGEL